VIVQPEIAVVRPETETQQSRLRMGLLEQLNGLLSMRDTPRGLVATVPDSDFSGSLLRPGIFDQLARVATIVEAHPGLRIDIEGNTDSAATEDLSSQRAESVRRALIAQGLPEGSVSARTLGDSHPIGPNSSLTGRQANRRVEIVISGNPIGNFPFWDRSYTLNPGPVSQIR
jgi:flagellar motor protein MotB